MADNKINNSQEQENKKKKKGFAAWWHNLGKGGQIAICALLGVGVATAVVVPTVIAINNKQSTPDIKVIGADIDKNASSIALNKDSTVAFTYADNKDFVKINYVKVGGKELTENVDYKRDNSNSQSQKIVIYAKAMTSVKVEISIELKDKITETTKTKWIEVTDKLYKTFNKSTDILTLDNISSVTVNGVKCDAEAVDYGTTNGQKYVQLWYTDAPNAKPLASPYYTATSLSNYIVDEKNGGHFIINNDGSTEYYCDDGSVSQGDLIYKKIKVDKNGFMISQNCESKDGSYKSSAEITLTGELQKNKTINIFKGELLKKIPDNITISNLSTFLTETNPELSFNYENNSGETKNVSLGIYNDTEGVETPIKTADIKFDIGSGNIEIDLSNEIKSLKSGTLLSFK